MEEFNLSNRIFEMKIDEDVMNISDIKEFIKILKKRIRNSYTAFAIRDLDEKGQLRVKEYRTEYTEKEWVLRFIDELAGYKLIDSYSTKNESEGKQ